MSTRNSTTELHLKEVINSLSLWNNCVFAKSWRCRMFNGYLFLDLHAPRGPFYSPKGPRSHWRSIWKALVAFCPRVHQTVRCTPDSEQCVGWARAENPWLAAFLFWGTGPSDVGHRTIQCATWPLLLADMAASRCVAGTPDCPAPRTDRLVNYSQHRLKILRAESWLDHAPDCLVGGTAPSSALQSSTLSLNLSLFSFAPFGLEFIKSLALRQTWLAHKPID
jgi:hypothetical protein